jgi:hypothetical protein
MRTWRRSVHRHWHDGRSGRGRGADLISIAEDLGAMNLELRQAFAGIVQS